LSVLRSDNIVETILGFIKEKNINIIVVGKSKETHRENNFIKSLENNISNVEICIV